jgi:tetratricopeptide (TPR) repeat protein
LAWVERCAAGKQQEALPWLERAVANAPNNYSVLNDYGWGLAELGRFDEAQKALEKAVQLAPATYDLPANNLKRCSSCGKTRSRGKGRGNSNETTVGSENLETRRNRRFPENPGQNCIPHV